MGNTDYVQMMLEESLGITRYETDLMMESIEYEAEYIMQCMETNTIPVMEAAAKKPGIFRRFIDTIKRIFASFRDKVNEIVNDLKPWKEEYIDKLNDISYEGLTIKAFPHWKVKGADIERYVKNAQSMFSNSSVIDTSNGRVDTPEKIVNGIAAFKDFRSKDTGYREVMKMVLSTGDVKSYKSEEITDASIIKNTICAEAKTYIENYKNLSNSLTNLSNALNKDLEEAEKEYESVKESYNPYLMLEGAHLFDTDLVFCANGGLLLEAEAPSQNTNQNTNDDKKESSKAVDVDSTNDNGSNNNQNNDNQAENKPSDEDRAKATFKRGLAKVNVDLITTAITVAEEKLYVYKAIIKQVVTASNKASKDTKKDESEDNKDTKEDSKKTTKELKEEKKAANKAYRQQKLANAKNAVSNSKVGKFIKGGVDAAKK